MCTKDYLRYSPSGGGRKHQIADETCAAMTRLGSCRQENHDDTLLLSEKAGKRAQKIRRGMITQPSYAIAGNAKCAKIWLRLGHSTCMPEPAGLPIVCRHDNISIPFNRVRTILSSFAIRLVCLSSSEILESAARDESRALEFDVNRS